MSKSWPCEKHSDHDPVFHCDVCVIETNRRERVQEFAKRLFTALQLPLHYHHMAEHDEDLHGCDTPAEEFVLACYQCAEDFESFDYWKFKDEQKEKLAQTRLEKKHV